MKLTGDRYSELLDPEILPGESLTELPMCRSNVPGGGRATVAGGDTE